MLTTILKTTTLYAMTFAFCIGVAMFSLAAAYSGVAGRIRRLPACRVAARMPSTLWTGLALKD